MRYFSLIVLFLSGCLLATYPAPSKRSVCGCYEDPTDVTRVYCEENYEGCLDGPSPSECAHVLRDAFCPNGELPWS